MSYLQEQMKVLKFDKRLLEMNFKKGTINQDDYKNHINQLPDDVNNAEALSLDSDSDKQEEAAATPTEETAGATDMHGAPSVSSTNTDPFGSGY